MRKKLSIITTIICAFIIFINTLDVSAGTIDLSIEGNSTVVVGNTIDITVKASNIIGFDKGLATAQGDISFDRNFLEYVKYKNASSSLSSSYGTTTQRFVSLGMGGEYISSSDNLITLTFKAKQVGTTEVSLHDTVVGDTKAIVHTAKTSPKTIQIVGEGTKPSGSNSSPSTNSKPQRKPSVNKGNSASKASSSKSSNNSLESLVINNAKMAPSFSPTNTNYQVTVPHDVSKLDISYKAADSKAKVEIVGNGSLKVGSDNTVKIIVTAEDGTTKTYVLSVDRGQDSSNNKLASLEIKEMDLSPKFDPDVNEYHLTLDKKVKNLTIDAIPVDKNSKVEIIDNADLDKDNSIVLVKVTDKNGFSNYYKLKVDYNTQKKILLFGVNIIYILLILFILIILLFFLLLLLKKKDEEEEQKQNNLEQDDLYDDVVTKDELVDAITEKNPKKLKMLLTQEEANKLKDAVKAEEYKKEEEMLKKELIIALEKNDKQRIKEIAKKVKLLNNNGLKNDDDRIKEEIIKSIEESDVVKLRKILEQEEEDRERREWEK